MSDPKQDAKIDPSPINPDPNAPPSREKGREGRDIEEVMIENKRKQAEIDSLRAEKAEWKERLEELEEKERLTEKEKAEKASLEAGLDSIDSQVKLLRQNPDTNQKVWLKAMDEAADTASLRATWELEKRRSNEVLEDLVDEHGEKLKVKSKKELGDMLAPYGAKYNKQVESGDMTLVTRTRKAFRDFMKDKAQSETLEARERELKKKEAALAALEGGGRARRVSTVDDFKTLSGSKKISAVVDALGSTKTR